uniref:zinc finger protein ZAT12-like n=1 Tax=Erigeron canadensis TaxID=72917 RepID=UPI001CB99D3E|nr:zinc finger protein ZAT12-like [Erigeron canadensis]
MTVKRPLENDTEIETMAMANCLMLLSRVGKTGSDSLSEPGRLFYCKTCNRPFQSFQALGGHRASHKRPKLNDLLKQSPPKPKTHECSVCGQEFAIGQALGGHMRRHRDEVTTKSVHTVVKNESEKRRSLFLDLDLNLMPYENDLKLWPIVT